MANARVATAALLGTVTDTATAISGMVNTIAGSMDMANAFVRNQQAKQRLTHTLDLATFEKRKLEELSVETAQRKKQIADTLSDPALRDYYNESYAELQALLHPQQA